MGKRKIVTILLIISLILLTVTHSSASPAEKKESSDATGSENQKDLIYESPTDEPMPCTNQRGKEWFGCN